MADEKIVSIKIQTEAETKSISDLQTRLVKLTKQRNQLNKKIRDGVTLTKAEKQSLGQLQPELVATRNKLRDMERQVVKNNNALKKNSGFVAGVKKGMIGAVKSIGAMAVGFVALGRVVGNIATVIKDFDQSQGNLRAVTGKTKDELASLTKQAKELGSTTAFTATQTTEAQIELAKLGFTVKEITQLTPSVLSLASATGTDLANASAIAGSTVRAFGLNASETKRVVDVMANSFTKSSLDISKFQTAIANVGPVANSAGVSLEETTALIGTLTDAGIDASTAGTGLRNVFLELAKSGMTFDEAMGEIQNSTNKNATALKLFGKRGATIGTVLAGNTEKTRDLTLALNDSAGAAEKMADEQLNTLSGRVTILTSAWEGLILKIDSGESVFSNAFNSVTEWTTGFLVSMTNVKEDWDVMINGFDKASEASIQATIKMSRSTEVPFDKLTRLNDFLERFNDQTLEDLENNIEQQRIAFIRSAEAHNKSTAEATGLWNAYINLRREEEATTEETEKNTKATELNNQIKEELKKTTKKLTKEESKRIDNLIRERKEREANELYLEGLRLENLKNLKVDYVKKTNDEIELVEMEYEEEETAKEDEKINNEIKKQEDKNKEILENKLLYLNAGAEASELLLNSLALASTKRLNDETEELKRQKKEGLITEEEYITKINQIRKKDFDNQKKLALANTAIQTASAIARIWAEVPKVDFGASTIALTALATANGLAQAGAIGAQQYQPIEFADGGLLQGPSHANGGIAMTVNGMGGYEAEGGEAIINKKSTAMFAPLLSQINEAGGGVSFSKPLSAKKFAVGGLTPNVAPQTGNNDLINAINNRIDNIQVTNVATDTAGVANRVQNIENDASFG